jgi:NADPH:quinone reductase-like Zn-dependent oxidoreductase
MRALVVEKQGDRGAVQNVPIPKPGDGEVLVRVTAAGLNPIDWKAIERNDHEHPMVVGQDFAGIVVATGDGANEFRVNDRVFGIAREHGAFAEYTVVPEHDSTQPIAKLPDDLADVHAAALPTAGLTALAALDALGVPKNGSLLILGVAGGVGGFAAQIARVRGIHVVGTAHSHSDAYVRELGVRDVIAYDREDVIAATRSLYPDGVDGLLDLVNGPDRSRDGARALKAGGTIVSTIGALDTEWFAQRKLHAVNLVMAETTRSSPESLSELAHLVQERNLHVGLASVPPLEGATAALEESRGGRINGKIVVIVASSP